MVCINFVCHDVNLICSGCSLWNFFLFPFWSFDLSQSERIQNKRLLVSSFQIENILFDLINVEFCLIKELNNLFFVTGGKSTHV